jgi:hypothetical protein
MLTDLLQNASHLIKKKAKNLIRKCSLLNRNIFRYSYDMEGTKESLMPAIFVVSVFVISQQTISIKLCIHT